MSLCDFVHDFDWVTCLLYEYLLLHLKSCKVFIIGCVTYVVAWTNMERDKYGYLNYAYDLKVVPNLSLGFKCSSCFVDAWVVLL